MSNMKDLTVFALESLLEYAKYLEDNNSLTYQRLADRVETFKKAPLFDERIDLTEIEL